MKKHFNLKHLFWIVPLVLLIGCCAAFGLYTYSRSLPVDVPPLTEEQQIQFSGFLAENYKEPLTRELPYPVKPASFFIYAKAGIIIDASNGCVLYEKNADEIIPPASMAKIALMYVTFEAIKNGETSLDTVVDLVPESWAKNAPLQSSVMGLGPNQIVTLNELLLGLSVASGNDAATAIACHISGSVEKFCERENAEMEKLGLTHTRFVDASGYSELNLTTPREFAALARVYIERYPDALKTYHSAESLTFPTADNYPPDWTGRINTRKMYATNRLLDIIEGCDGLKTGFIYESGYNISLTAKRGDTRFISVTMGGPGIGTAEGNKYRVADGKKLQEWAFSSFKTYPAHRTDPVPVKLWGGKDDSLYACEAQTHSITVPNVKEDAADSVSKKVFVTREALSPVECGTVLGKVQYSVDGIILEEIPLVADRTVARGNWFKRTVDKLSKKLIDTLNKK